MKTKQYEVELVKKGYKDCIVEAKSKQDAVEKAYNELMVEDFERELWHVSYVEIVK